ncbi:MAG TPA: CaiB/BaiF CoA-transferase family protein [Stellaceae bacterium]|jgi:crotonobetainyl-CoA:carnitine CoA-transferase CaiB-like acyl-CoA transferase
MTRPFEGIRIIDITHVLAGPFAAYQLAVLGADVIKVEHPDEPDQSRETGSDRALNRRNMGTSFLTQGSNKRSITLDLKTAEGRDILKKLVARSDVLVENYRPGAFEALGLGYEAMLKVNPRLIYCSISAFGQDGVRREQTAYDHVIQASSGIMAATGTEEVNPIKVGVPAVDYATGTMGAFALAAALFQRERTGKGQHIDLAMLGVAMMMQASLLTGYFRNGTEPQPPGNKQPFATNSAYDAKEGMVMIGASNIRQQARFWRAVERPDMIKTDNEARLDDRAREAAIIADIIKTKTADEWESYFQARRVPAARVRTMAEALADPHFKGRGVFHHFDSVAGIEGRLGVPLAAFKFAHGGPLIEHPPHEMGQDTDDVLGELGCDEAEIVRLRAAGVI